MSMAGVLSQAASGLSSIQNQLGTVSQNIANANTADYVKETLSTESVTAGGIGMGVRSGVATRTVDAAMQTQLFQADVSVTEGQVRRGVLQAVDQASGAPGSGQDLASQVGALRDAFSTLANDPSNATQQRAVVNQASTLAGTINAVGQTITTQRQSMQDSLVADVATANSALASVGQLSNQIISAQVRGESVADLQDKRDTAVRTVMQLTGAQFVAQSNGDLLAVSGGTVLPTHASTGPLAITSATMLPGSVGPAITVAGVAAPISGGQIGAELDLRDNVLPTAQASLDGFAQSLATGFSGQGLTLFSDNAGAIPAAGTPGFAQAIQVDPAVQTTPSMVRDGAAVAGAAGNTTLINAVLGNVLGTGVGTIAAQAADLVANNASQAATVTSKVTLDQSLQSSLQTKLSAQTGVSVDTEMTSMVSLQNSYGANARMISAVQAMWTQLLTVVQ